MRISSNTVSLRMIEQIQQGQRALFSVQERVASGKRLNRPADDPQGTSQVMAQQTALELNAQYQRNADVANSELAVSEQALTSMTAVLQRVQELATQAANSTIGAAERQQIAQEVNQLLGEAVNIGNSRYAGRYIFAGHRTGAAPFVPDVSGYPGAINYVGDNGELRRELAQGDRLTTNLTGDRLSGIYTTLIDLRDNLMANDVPAVAADSATVSARMDETLSLRSEIGTRVRRVETALEQLGDAEQLSRTLISDIEDADLAYEIVDLQRREVALTAALGATGRALNLSLLDFLR